MKLNIKFFIAVLLFTSQIGVFAQSSSSYSRIGIGDLVHTYSARRLAIGGLGVAVSDKDNISAINPAGWNSLEFARVDFGFTYRANFLQSSSQSAYYGRGDFNGFTFGIPVSQTYGVGAAIGLIPVSNVSYTVSQNSVLNTATSSEIYNTSYDGQGGISRAFIGSSYRLPFGLNVGATFDYYFGNIKYTSKTNFLNSSNTNAAYSKTVRPQGLGTSIGLISPDISGLFNSEKISDARLGFAMKYISNLKTDTIMTSSSSAGTDTLGEGAVHTKIPIRINAGLSFKLNKNYQFSLDYLYQPMKDYTFNGLNSPNLRNTFKISTGFEYSKSDRLGLSFWEQFAWRAGLSYEQTQYIINNQGINQYSISGGFSMPLGFGNSLDVGIQYGIRGTTNSNLYRENNIKLDVSISLGEIWFIRHQH